MTKNNFLTVKMITNMVQIKIANYICVKAVVPGSKFNRQMTECANLTDEVAP